MASRGGRSCALRVRAPRSRPRRGADATRRDGRAATLVADDCTTRTGHRVAPPPPQRSRTQQGPPGAYGCRAGQCRGKPPPLAARIPDPRAPDRGRRNIRPVPPPGVPRASRDLLRRAVVALDNAAESRHRLLHAYLIHERQIAGDETFAQSSPLAELRAAEYALVNWLGGRSGIARFDAPP